MNRRKSDPGYLDLDELRATLAECVEHQRAGNIEQAKDAGSKLLHLLGLSDLLRETARVEIGDYTLYAPEPDLDNFEWGVMYSPKSGGWKSELVGTFPSRKAAMAGIMKHRQSLVQVSD